MSYSVFVAPIHTHRLHSHKFVLDVDYSGSQYYFRIRRLLGAFWGLLLFVLCGGPGGRPPPRVADQLYALRYEHERIAAIATQVNG